MKRNKLQAFILTLLLIPEILSGGIINFVSDSNWQAGETIFTLDSFVQDLESSQSTLVLNFNEASPTSNDESASNNTVTFSNVTTGSGYFGNSIVFNGTTSYATVGDASDPDFDFGSGDFTIHYWVYQDVVVSDACYHISMDVTGYTGALLVGQGTSHYYYFSINGTTYVSTTLEAAAGIWRHVAIVGTSNDITMYVNGTSVKNIGSRPTFILPTTPLRLSGSARVSYGQLPGLIDALQVIKGKALWTSNFTPPAMEPSGTR